MPSSTLATSLMGTSMPSGEVTVSFSISERLLNVFLSVSTYTLYVLFSMSTSVSTGRSRTGLSAMAS
ncbi:hypothetical protein D3C73_1303130 [compost metagenome]